MTTTSPQLKTERGNLTPFLLTQFASITSIISGSMVFIVLPWLALDLTGSATSSGLAVAMTSIPGLLLSPIVGSIIDRVGRRRMAIWVELLAALTAVLIPLSAGLFGMSLGLLIGLGMLRAVVSPGGSTARKALVPDVAAAAKITLDRANSIHEAVFASGFAIGPAVAAVCISLIGAVETFYVVAFFAFVSGLVASAIRVVEQHEENDPDEGQRFFIYALQGFKILFQTPPVLILMIAIMTLAVVYLPTEMVILPAYFNDLENPESLGLLISTMAAASVVGSLLFERLHKWLSFSNILRIGILGVGLSMLPMSQLLPVPLMLVFGAVLGLVWGPLMPLLNTVIQRQIPANKRGRVFSLEMTIWTAGPMLSMVLVGSAVDGIGVGPVYTALAILVLLAAVLVSTSKQIRELDQ